MNELQVKELQNKETQTIPSYEIAKMMERDHSKVLKMLEGETYKDGRTKVIGIIPTLTKARTRVSDYFIESTYKDKSGKTNKCYECTKMGCDMLANKMTGEKGILFTAKYVKRFNEMKNIINSNEQLKAKLLLDIYNGGQEGVIASKELVELEKKPLLETIEKQQPKVNTFDKFMNAEGLYTSTQMAKLFKMSSAMKLNKLLNAEGLIYKQGNTWMPYATANKEWFKVIVREREGHAFTQLKFTPIGVIEIAKILNVELNEDDLVDQSK